MLTKFCDHPAISWRTKQTLAGTSLLIALALYACATSAQTPLPPLAHQSNNHFNASASLPDWQYVTLGTTAHTYPLPIHANFKLNQSLETIRRVIIVLPSTRHSIGQHYLDVSSLILQNWAHMSDTLIISPIFPSPIDAKFSGVPAWKKSNWETGQNSTQAKGRPAPVSAYQVVDDILRRVADHSVMPELSQVVLAAHGGGAHLLQRYAMLNNMDEAIKDKGIAIRYVIANAPSYLYLTDERPRRNGSGFASYERGICPNYNHYPYGPQHLTGYATGLIPEYTYARYTSRDVVYLLGTADSNPEDHSKDKHCAAEAQGATRLSRGTGYIQYIHSLAKANPIATPFAHRPYRVNGVAHDAANMFGSQCGSHELLGTAPETNGHSAPCESIKPAL